jgi:hypothetical protein
MAKTSNSDTPGPAMRVYRVLRVVVLVLMIVVVFLVFHKSKPPEVSTAPDAAETLKAKLEEEQQATDAKKPHAMKLNEAELNSMLSSNLQLAPPAAAPSPAPSPTPAAPATAPEQAKDPTVEEVQSSVRDVKISLLEDRVLAYVVFLFHGQELSLQLEGQLGVNDGYLRFTPSAGKLGWLPLPQSVLTSAVVRLFDAPENKEKFKVPPEVADIRVSGSELVVSYR